MDWFRRGLVHLLGSDGHSPRRRPPRMADAYRPHPPLGRRRRRPTACAARNGMAVLQGLPLRVPDFEPRKVGWLPRLW